jgi:uncharacterized low-complexity protein
MINKPVAAAVGAAFVTSMIGSSSVLAADDPFEATELDAGYMVADHHKSKKAEGKCGEGKCGAEMKEKAAKHAEGKCGEGKCGGDMKAKAEKHAEGKCGGEMKEKAAKHAEGKCGSKDDNEG